MMKNPNNVIGDPLLTFNSPRFREELEQLFEGSFVVQDLEYKKMNLDYAVIVKDRLIEVCHVSGKQGAIAELATVGRAGRISFDKHKSIQAGTFITNAFYFLCPSRTLLAEEIPKPYGLITYNQVGKIDFKKLADFIKEDEYLTRDFYKTLSQKLAQKLYQK